MEIINKFNKYIKGTLPEEELESFTKEIVKDHFEKEELQNKWNRILQEEHNSKEGTGKIIPLSVKRFLKVALASVASISLALLCWFTYQSFSTSTYEKLLSAELKKPYVETIGRKGKLEELKIQATASYNEREYASAMKYFEQLNKLDEALDWDFYIGLCQLYQGQSDLAIESLSRVLEQSNDKYIIESNWYLGLAYSTNKDFMSAKKHLEFVANRTDDEMAWKVKEAKALLNALSEEEANE